MTTRNVLTPLRNEGKQSGTFNSEDSPQLQVESDNLTFLMKKHLQGKSQPYELSLALYSNFGTHADCGG